MMWPFEFDDQKHLMYSWEASPRHLELIHGLENAREQSTIRWNSKDMTANMEELFQAIEDGIIGCVYKYHIKERDLLQLRV